LSCEDTMFYFPNENPSSTVNYLTDDFSENVIISQLKFEDVGS